MNGYRRETQTKRSRKRDSVAARTCTPPQSVAQLERPPLVAEECFSRDIFGHHRAEHLRKARQECLSSLVVRCFTFRCGSTPGSGTKQLERLGASRIPEDLDFLLSDTKRSRSLIGNKGQKTIGCR